MNPLSQHRANNSNPRIRRILPNDFDSAVPWKVSGVMFQVSQVEHLKMKALSCRLLGQLPINPRPMDPQKPRSFGNIPIGFLESALDQNVLCLGKV